MFDCLLGGKFSKKCKHCIKCIKSRVVLIRKKRQATVRFLKKDVADLLASGHDLNAFGRIEALIVEINHTSCYDMIEQYCECILNQLPSLQKQRECPKDAMEAVSTLIYAAARFSDLPELYDLRGLFTERYGSRMESSVNAEFVEKFQKKSFAMERKLRSMKDIAEEFSVRWDSKAFQQKLSNPPAPPSDRPVTRKNVEPRSHSEMNGRNAAPNLQKEAVFNGRKEAVFDDDKNRTEVFIADGVVNGRNEAIYGRDRKALNEGGGSFNRRKEEVFNVDIADNGRRKTVIDSDVAVNKRAEAAISTNEDQEVQCTERWEPLPRCSVQKQRVHPEPRDIHAIPIIRNASKETENVGPIYDDVAARARATESPESEKGLDPALQPVNSKNARPMSMIPPPYIKPSFKNPSADADDHERSNGGEKVKPVSVRRRLPTPPPVIKTSNAIDETVHRHQKNAGEEIHGDFNRDRNVHGTSNGRRKHGGRGSNGMYDGDCDEEEEVMDRLLLHLSKKEVNGDDARRRTRTRAPPAELVADASGRSHCQPERVASLRPESKGPTVDVGIGGRGPSRTASIQPDMLSPNGANPRNLDYNDLIARFNALKRT